MAAEVLSDRALNRATLARQLLLERAPLPAAAALEYLVGLQGQAPLAPYVALWSRLAGSTTDELAGLLMTRGAVRMSLMRSTVHLVTADDALRLRPLVQPVLDRAWGSSPFARELAGVDMQALLAAGRALLDERPRTRPELSRALAERWPHRDDASLAYAVTYTEPVVQVPPRGVWGQSAPPAYARLEPFLGRPLDATASLHDLVWRVVRAFGPASVRDVQTWCGLTRLREVLEALRPNLRTFRDERGVELFDLPDAPRPDAETPAPVRFLPEYDNLLLSHHDRRRVIPPGQRVPLPPGNGAAMGTVLVDGVWRATWRVRAGQLAVEALGPITAAEVDAVEAEGAALLALVAPGEKHDVRLSLARSTD